MRRKKQRPLPEFKKPNSMQSRRMAAVRSKDTIPERIVGSAVHRGGFRFRLHRRDLPGCPDLVLPRYNTVIFVHGCFWHGHECSLSNMPRTNSRYWREKIRRNRARDLLAEEELGTLGWRVGIVRECSISRDVAQVLRRLRAERKRISSG